MKGECNSKRKENFLSYYNLSDRIIFWTKQAASGNRKAVFIAPVGTVFIYENNAILCSANQSRDAKSCVSQARMRNKQMRNMPAITALFARETQNFASLLGWRHCYFDTKKRASECNSVLHISPHTLPYPATFFLSFRADASSAIC